MAARKPATDKATKTGRTTGNAVVPWNEELARYAEAAAATEANAGGGQFFSVKSGILSWQDAPMPGNRMAVVILDSIFENVFYEGEYDPAVISPPTCFAFGRDEATMTPHANVIAIDQAQHEECHGCPMNEWGSADKGRGKACRNTRRLAMIPAGTIDKQGNFEAETDEEHFRTAGVGYMKLPVTSVKGYAGFVKQLNATLKRPPFAVFAQVSVVPDADTQFKVLFEVLEEVPDDLIQVMLDRRKEVEALIEFPYQLDREEAPAPTRGGKPVKGQKAAPARSGKPAVKKGGRY